ncbi:MAG TPA: carboxypeptidase-like regulatory domain-containing protein [Nitrososphaeraceae archaeon]|nr:carboxypeptidase-like regulatory domain-containing protein [Nitrososphaeraceae archaeon]
MQLIANKHNIYEMHPHKNTLKALIRQRKMITISVAIISTILLTGYFGSNILSPNGSLGSIFDPLPVYKNGLGAINGYALNEFALPLIGTTMIAVEQGGFSKTTTLSVTGEGKFLFQDLDSGKYVIIAAFPDGTTSTLNNVNVEPNSVQTLIFKS